MARFFNIGGPCVAAQNYMLPAAERLPKAMSLVDKGQYFVIHAPRQCGKTTMFLGLVNEINAKGEKLALYCTVETVQEFTDPTVGLPKIANVIRRWGCTTQPGTFGRKADALEKAIDDSNPESCVQSTLQYLAEMAGKPLVLFVDEVDCLSEGTLVTFLRQLRSGKIAASSGSPFPSSVALIGMRNIRDYRMRIRPDGESTGEASPFNVITEAMRLRVFTEQEMRALYAQHTAETGQAFEEGALAKAWTYSEGQPYLVNALARWCVEEIHREDYSTPITADDMEVAKEKIIRERGTHLDSILEKAKDPRIRPIVEQLILGGDVDRSQNREALDYALDLGLIVEERGVVRFANPMYACAVGRYLTRGVQDEVMMRVPENPWVSDAGVDVAGLLAAFQRFWRENANPNACPYQFREAYPQLVLQAFLQRVVNGGGQVVPEMAFGSERMDVCLKYQAFSYAIEVKTRAYYDKSHEKAHAQLVRYMDRLGVSEGWLVVFDPDYDKPWDEKIAAETFAREGRTLHLIRC